MHIKINGETLQYERAGSGPPLVLIHSLGTGAWMWREQIRYWSGRYDVVAIDARGHGGSTHNGEMTVRAVASDTLDVIRALGLGPAHVVGISMGGPIGAHIWQLDPGIFRSFVLADSFARQGEAGKQRAADIATTLASTSMADYGKAYAKGTLFTTTPREVFDELADSIAGMDRDAYVGIAQSVFTSDVADLLASFSKPARILVGSADQRTPVRLSEEIAALMPAARMRIIDDASHLSNLDQPKAFQDAVDEFLEEMKS